MRNGKGFAQSINEINAARKKAGMKPLDAEEIEKFADEARKEWNKVPWDNIEKSLGKRPPLNTKEEMDYMNKRDEFANERVYRSLKSARARFMPSAAGKKVSTIADDIAELGSRGTTIGAASGLGAAGLAAIESLRKRKNELASEGGQDVAEEAAKKTDGVTKAGNVAKSIAKTGWDLINPLDVVHMTRKVPVIGAGLVGGFDAYQQSQESGPWDWAGTRDAIGGGGTLGISDRIADAWNREVPRVNQGDLNPYLTALGSVKEGLVEGVADTLTLGGFDYYTKGPEHSPIFGLAKDVVTTPFRSKETEDAERRQRLGL